MVFCTPLVPVSLGTQLSSLGPPSQTATFLHFLQPLVSSSARDLPRREGRRLGVGSPRRGAPPRAGACTDAGTEERSAAADAGDGVEACVDVGDAGATHILHQLRESREDHAQANQQWRDMRGGHGGAAALARSKATAATREWSIGGMRRCKATATTAAREQSSATAHVCGGRGD